MHWRSPLYKVLKRELKAQGHWKDLPRYKGNPDNFTKGGKIAKQDETKILQ